MRWAPELFLLGLGFIVWMVGMLTAAPEQDDEFTQAAGYASAAGAAVGREEVEKPTSWRSKGVPAGSGPRACAPDRKALASSNRLKYHSILGC